jgi:OpgC protein
MHRTLPTRTWLGMHRSVAVREPVDNLVAPPTAVPRDATIDFLRGLAICLVVVNHLPTPSLLYLLTIERIGIVTGAEPFVIISGLVLGIVHRRRIEHGGWRASAVILLRRALQLYLAIVVLGIVVCALQFVPGVRSDVLRTWTSAATGVTYDLFPADPFGHPAQVAGGLLLLQFTPWQFNIMGLYVFLLALSPLAFALFAANRPLVVIVASWGLYVLNAFVNTRLTPCVFEVPFPLLTWQLLFFQAAAIGFYRRELAAFFSGTRLRVLQWAAGVLFVALMFYAWNNPWTGTHPYADVPQWARLHVIPERLFNRIYSAVFLTRDRLGAGRLLNAAVVMLVMYWLVARASGVRRRLGWFFVPMGQATLYVFIMHLFVIVLIVNIVPGVHRLRTDTAIHVAALLTLWLCVRTRFLYTVVPR